MSKTDISRAGHHFLIGLRPTAQLHERDRALLADLRPTGVVLFKSNFLQDLPYERWLDGYSQLIADVRSTVGRERIFIGIDHEGSGQHRTQAHTWTSGGS
jgi:beta-N-acetylhexosaminidase